MRDERGQAALEMLVVMLILVPVLLGGLDLAQGVSARQALENGTAVAARRIALDPAGWAQAVASVQDAVDNSFLGGAGTVTCNVTDAAGSAVDPALLPFAAPFSLACSVPFQADIPFASTTERTLTARHHEVLERYP